MTTGRVLGQFTDYDTMLALVRSRVNELQVQRQAFDQYAGLPDKYLAKLVGENPVRRIGMTSMGPLFTALGVRCVMIEDPAATERLRQRLKPRNGSFVRASYMVNGITNRKWARIQALGRKVRWAKMTKAERSEYARALNVFRWRNNGNGYAPGGTRR